jgi:DNA-directed RNA polymerase subunit RPC12/RpoP
VTSDYDNDLLQEGIFRIRSKEYEQARRYLERALDAADDLETRARASYWLSVITPDAKEKRQLLEDALAIDPVYPQARRALAILDGRLKPEQIVDPEAVPAPAPGTAEVQADRFTCPQCGGRMTYSADGRSLVCESCQSREQLGTAAQSKEDDFFIAMASGLGQRKPVSMVTFQCQGCGASFILAPQELSATCAYCGSAHVVATRERRELLEPDTIVPMAIDQEQAAQALVGWVKKKGITPRVKVLPPRGLYLPVWVFDILGNIPWSGVQTSSDQSGYIPGAEEILLSTTLGVSSRHKEPISGVFPVHYDHVCVTGMHRLAELLVKLIPEFDLRSAPAYDPRYLSGWPAEIYEVSMADASLEARKIAVEQVRREIKSELAHVQEPHYSPSDIEVTGFKLALVPVWVAEIPLKDFIYYVMINGQTGTVCGWFPARGFWGWLDTQLGP